MPVIQLELDSKGAISSLQKFDKAIEATERNTETAFGKMRKSVNSMGLAVGVFIASASAAIAAFSLKAASMASSMVEAQGVFDSAFEGMTETAEEWARVLGEAYHLSELKAKESLNTFQLVLRGMGLATDQAGKMSFALTKVAADLGAAFDKDTVDVVNDIRSALAGSTEVMSKYGIVVKQAQIVNEALELGLIRTKGEITETTRAQALFSLIMKKSQPIIGTTAREAEGYAGQLKEAKKNVEDLVTALGARLLPVFTLVLKAFNDWISTGDRMNKIIDYTIEAARFLINGVLGIELVFKAAIVVIAKFTQGVSELLQPFGVLIDAFNYLTGAEGNPIYDMKVAVDNFVASSVEGFGNTVEKIEAMNLAFDRAKTKIEEVEEAVAAIDTTTAAVKGTTEAVKRTGEAVDAVKEKHFDFSNQATDQLKLVNSEWANTAQVVNEAKAAVTEVDTGVVKVKTDVDLATQSMNNFKASADTAAIATGKVADAASRVASATGGSNKSGKTHKMGSAPAMTAEEMARYISKTPAGRGDHYFSDYDKGSSGIFGGSKTYDKLDKIRLQKEAALKDLYDRRKASAAAGGGTGASDVETPFGGRGAGNVNFADGSSFGSIGSFGKSKRSTIINNFNQQISVSDIQKVTSQQTIIEDRA